MPKEIVKEEEVPLPVVKKVLAKRAKEGELTYQQNITLEYATSFSKMTPAAAVKVMEKLMKNYELTRAQAVQVINIAPTTVEELRIILDTRATSLTKEQINEILELITKNTSKGG